MRYRFDSLLNVDFFCPWLSVESFDLKNDIATTVYTILYSLCKRHASSVNLLYYIK